MNLPENFLEDWGVNGATAVALGWTPPTSSEPYLDPADPTSGMNESFYWKDPQGQCAPLPNLLKPVTP